MIDSIRIASKLSAEILGECINNFSNFKTEKDVANYLKNKTKQNNLKLAFPPLVVSNKNFLEIHHKPNNTELKNFVILDFGIRYKDYCGDITRMVYKGTPTKKDLELYNLILSIHKTCIKEAKIGMVNPEDFETINRLKEALSELSDYQFTYFDNHASLISRLRSDLPRFVLNLCDEGFDNDAFKELHIPSLLELLGISYSGAGPACLGLCYNKFVVLYTDAITAETNDFRFARPYCGLEVIEKSGTLIARDGRSEVRTPYDECVLIMPSRRLRRGQTAVRLGRYLP